MKQEDKMKKIKWVLFLFVFVVANLTLGIASSKAFADDWGDRRRATERYDRNWQQRGWGQREHVDYHGQRYDYHEGRFYAQSLFGFILESVPPPRGIVVTYLPTGYRTIIVGRTTYYEYENVYYQPAAGGYVVVDPPVVVTQYAPAPVVYAPEAPYAPSQSYQGKTVVVNVPTARRGTIAVTMIRNANGFTGPQGEFYPIFPATEELSARYGR
jgi:hypothetical protein